MRLCKELKQVEVLVKN